MFPFPNVLSPEPQYSDIRIPLFAGVGPALVRLCKSENTTLVYRNLVVLLIVAHVQENLQRFVTYPCN